MNNSTPNPKFLRIQLRLEKAKALKIANLKVRSHSLIRSICAPQVMCDYVDPSEPFAGSGSGSCSCSCICIRCPDRRSEHDGHRRRSSSRRRPFGVRPRQADQSATGSCAPSSSSSGFDVGRHLRPRVLFARSASVVYVGGRCEGGASLRCKALRPAASECKDLSAADAG